MAKILRFLQQFWYWNFPVICTYTLWPHSLQSFMKICAAQFKMNCTDKLFIYGTVLIQQMTKILSSKGPKFLGKIRNWNFLDICTSKHCFLLAYKVSQNSVQRFKRSLICWKKRNKTDSIKMIDWWTGQKFLRLTCCIGYKKLY